MPLNLSGTDFSRADVRVRPRLIMAIDGLDGSGKTHFALTAPGPIAYLNFDVGYEGVLHKFTGKEIVQADYLLRKTTTGQIAVSQEKAKELWASLVRSYTWALEHTRTVIVDTATDAWELLRLARFGKVAQIMPEQYGPVNAEYRRFVTLAYEYDANLILLHKMKERYDRKAGATRGTPTGIMERAGMKETRFLVQFTGRIAHDVEEGTFEMTVEKCRHDPGIVGMTLSGPLVEFPALASMIVDGTTEDDWV